MERRGEGGQLSFLCSCGKTAYRDEKSWLLPLMLRPALPFATILWRTARARAGARPLPMPGVRCALASGGSSSRPKQPAGVTGYPVHPLPYADPSVVRIQVLVLSDLDEIVA